MDTESFRPHASRASALLKAMGNERRLLILCYLAERERTVGELEKLIDISQSALSQHLARLRRDDLVMTRRSAQNIYYSLTQGTTTQVMAALVDAFCPGNGGLGRGADD